MKFHRTKLFSGIFVTLLILGVGYYSRENTIRFLQIILNQLQPCQRPITYSIVNIDPRFVLTKTELLNAVAKAEKIWELPINKQLFEYSSSGNLKINFVYDYRQKATDAMKKIGVAINNDKSTYDALKTKYNSFVALYKREKAQIDALIKIYEADKAAFEKEVNYWNKRGGAPEKEYNILEQKRIDLNNQISTINQAKDSLNGLIDNINSAEVVLDKLINTLNLQVDTYNTVSSSTGEEFSEGEYISGAGQTTINIFQYNNTDQLVRVLAHELGHALGLKHINNPEAIMYYLNEATNIKLTADDIMSLKKLCKIN